MASDEDIRKFNIPLNKWHISSAEYNKKHSMKKYEEFKKNKALNKIPQNEQFTVEYEIPNVGPESIPIHKNKMKVLNHIHNEKKLRALKVLEKADHPSNRHRTEEEQKKYIQAAIPEDVINLVIKKFIGSRDIKNGHGISKKSKKKFKK